MIGRVRHPAGCLAACCVLALGACGSSDEPEGEPLPADTVTLLQSRLDEIERRYQDAIDNGNVGACNDIATDSMPAIESAVAGLPQSVDPELRDAVERSFARLRELTSQACAGVEPEETVPEPVPEPVPEEEIPEETAPAETTPVEPPPPPDEKEKDKEKDKEKEKDKGEGGGGIEVPPGLEEEG